MTRQPEITRQGHWHVEYVRPLARGRRIRAWEIGTEEKRPTVDGYMWSSEDKNRWLTIEIESREGSLHFREGEDGSEPTEIALPVPREGLLAFVWRRFVKRYRTPPFWTVVSDHDKYAVHVVLVRMA